MPEIRPTGDGFGREVVGIDCTGPLNARQSDWVEEAFAEHAVLVFRKQKFEARSLYEFACRFGVPQKHVMLNYRHSEIAEVSYVRNVDDDGNIDPFGVRRATNWHTDSTFESRLPRLALLHALEVPKRGGGTIFADMRAAYDALDPAMKARLEDMTGIHGFNAGPGGGQSIYANQTLSEEHADQLHPAVMTHPDSGRRILFVNPSHVHGFDGLARDEGLTLVEALWQHAIQQRFLYHHRWQPGDLVLWDELATMHRNAGDADPNERRILLRCIVYPAVASPTRHEQHADENGYPA